jgi:hypothetical protein
LSRGGTIRRFDGERGSAMIDLTGKVAIVTGAAIPVDGGYSVQA